MTPLEFQNKVFVWSIGSQGAGWNTRAMDHALPHGPCGGCTIDVDPPIKRLAVEKGPPILCRFLRVLGMEERHLERGQAGDEQKNDRHDG